MVFALCFRPWTHTPNDSYIYQLSLEGSDSYCMYLSWYYYKWRPIARRGEVRVVCFAGKRCLTAFEFEFEKIEYVQLLGGAFGCRAVDGVFSVTSLVGFFCFGRVEYLRMMYWERHYFGECGFVTFFCDMCSRGISSEIWHQPTPNSAQQQEGLGTRA